MVVSAAGRYTTLEVRSRWRNQICDCFFILPCRNNTSRLSEWQQIMTQKFVDFCLTQGSPSHQLLTLAQAPTYPSYYIKLHDGGTVVLPSGLHNTPDVSISHHNYLSSSFAEATFQRYRNGISVTYPETGLRTPLGDVTTTVEDTLPTIKQTITCESLAERRYTLSLCVDGKRDESYSWHPPPRNDDRVHFLELTKSSSSSSSSEDQLGEGDGEAIAKVLLKSWRPVAKGELIAVVRVREDILDDREDVRGTDQILVTAVALVARLNRRRQNTEGYHGAAFYGY